MEGSKLSNDPEFNKMVQEAMEKFNRLSPAEQAAQRKAQRVSWVYGEMRLAGYDVTREEVERRINRYDEEST